MEEQNSVRSVIKEIAKGEPVTSKDILKALKEKSGKDINSRYINNILARISNFEKNDLGYFIKRTKQGSVYVYKAAEELLAMPFEKIYGLTLKTGNEKYSLEKALKEFPALKKYTEKSYGSAKTRIGEESKHLSEMIDDQKKNVENIVSNVENSVSDFKEKVKTYVPEKSVYDKAFKIKTQKVSGKAPSYDETGIYFDITGEGEPVLAACNGIGVSTFFWKFVTNYFSPNCKIVLWDYRSHGKSDRAKNLFDLTMANCARDLKAVLDHNKVDKAVLMGHSMGCQVIFEFYRLFPDRVAGLIPILGSFGSPLSTFLNTDKMVHVVDLLHPLAFNYPEVINPFFNKLIFNPVSYVLAKVTKLVNWQHCKYQELRPYLEHLGSMDQRALMGMAKRMHEHDARDVLPSIQVPTLIIAGEDDLFTPLYISEEMHREIPGAEMLIIPRGSHAAIIEQPDLINFRIEKFINEKIRKS